MIFKTLKSETDNYFSRIGIFGKSFLEISESVKQTFDSVKQRKQDIKALSAFMPKKEAKKEVGGMMKYIFPKKAKDKESEAYDLSRYDNFKEDKAFALLDKLQGIHEDSQTDKAAWQKYFATLDKEKKWQIDFVQNNDLQKASLNDLIKANDEARKKALAYNEALNAQSLSSKALTFSLNALSVAGNMVIGFLASKAVEWFATGIYNAIHEVDNAKEKLLQSTGDFDLATSELQNLRKELDDTSERIRQLQSPNLSVTQEGEYEKLLEINEQLERSIALKEIEQRLNAEQAAADAADLYGKMDTGSAPSTQKVDEAVAAWRHGNVFYQGPVFGSVPGGGGCFESFIMPNTPGNPNAVMSGLDPP